MKTTKRPHCQCLHEIENNLKRTKVCRVTCSEQRQILKEREDFNKRIKP